MRQILISLISNYKSLKLLLAPLLYYSFLEFLLVCCPQLLDGISKRPLILIIKIFPMLLILLISYLYPFYKKENSRKTYKFGVYWDSKNIPHCPRCGGKFKNNSEYPECSKCGKKSHVGSPSGDITEKRTTFTRMNLTEAQKEVEKDKLLDK